MEVKITQLKHGADLPLPAYQSAQASGLDLLAAVQHDIVIAPGAIALIPSGICMAIPDGFEGQVRPRSGLAVKHGITVVNAPGTIDADYRGEIKIGLINLGPLPFTIRRGMRVAQLIVAPLFRAELKLVDALEPTERGTGGFGHSGQV
jgi:dUTP pyrophosphatase